MESGNINQAETRAILKAEDLPEFPSDQVITIYDDDPDWKPNPEITRSRHLVYTSEIQKQVSEAITKVLEFIGQHHEGRDFFAWRLAIDEVFPNALKHGHLANPNLECQISYTHVNGDTIMHVQDSGPGFNVSKQLSIDCTDDDHIEEDNGRGLMLMQQFMDEVRWNIEGNSVALWKKISQ